MTCGEMLQPLPPDLGTPIEIVNKVIMRHAHLFDHSALSWKGYRRGGPAVN
jgi:hypothetical protein